jgi:hypothetical protein
VDVESMPSIEVVDASMIASCQFFFRRPGARLRARPRSLKR